MTSLDSMTMGGDGFYGGVDLKTEILIPRHTILSRIKELADQISLDYSESEPILLGILNGAVFFFTDLIREMTIPIRMDFIRAASYGHRSTSSGVVKFTKDVEIPVQGQHIIIIEDIVDSGLTLTQIVEQLKEKGPASIRLCALIDKRECRKSDIHLDYWGFQVKEGFLVGYGLDFDEQYRYLPDICILKQT
jgi:hypoxanthine phosphoribosyltransferase